MDKRLTRRHILTLGTISVVSGVAGCLGDGTDDAGSTETDDTDSETEDDSQGSDTSTPDESSDETTDQASTDPDSLDLQEANVVEVSFEESGGSYSFDVALHHDDDGEEGYANWWQVERLDGTMLGRRDLLHAHSRQPFTRSETIDVPDEVSCVVVRGHDQTHEYGGVAMVADLQSGETHAIDQGTEQRSFDTGDCP